MNACERSDYIEIFCMYRYQITITLKSGEIVNGAATDTKIDEKKREGILVNTKDHSRFIALAEISTIKVNNSNPHISTLQFD
ncbi:MAG: Rho-binding antiterminator [Pseudomonadota bacterium]